MAETSSNCENVLPKNPENIQLEKSDNMEKLDKSTPTNGSEYDSAETYSDEENDEHERNGQSAHSESENQGHSGESDSEGQVIFEREEGDGQEESHPSKKVDDDEDKKNPQYIPKRGTFYEHDDRTADDGETVDTVDVEKPDKDGKKKVWQDKKERWSHDKFNDMDQAPKSRAELISIYGYDIRNEDGPPRARRRRRYGRGPNKYTRNWEDEDAYSKPTVIRKITKKPKSKKDLEDINNADNIKNVENDSPEVISEIENESFVSEPTEVNRNVAPVIIDENITKNNNSNSVEQMGHQNNKHQQRTGTGRTVKPKREIIDSDYRGFTKSRQYKSSKLEQSRVQNKYQKDENKAVNIQEIENEVSKMSIQDGNHKNNVKHNNQRQGSVPPRLQNEQKGSKRYSSIRQRSLPETTTPPFVQHSNYYGNDYSQQNQTSHQNIIQANPIHQANTQIPQIPPPALAPLPPQVPVTTTPILQAAPQFAPPFAQGPPFLQAGVAPGPFIPQQNAPIINYVQSQPQFSQTPYQGYQQQFNPVTQPTDLFQPQGGITYYSTQEQLVARAALPKRPKVAIPIVAPPEHRGRGRTAVQGESTLNSNDTPPVMNNEPIEKYEDTVEAIAQ